MSIAAKRARRRQADDVTAEKRREPGAENRQRQTGDDLIGAKTNAQERMDGRHAAPAARAAAAPTQALPGPDAGPGAGQGPHEHDPLDAEIEHPGALGDQLAKTGEENGGTRGHSGRQHGDDECRGEDIGHGESVSR